MKPPKHITTNGSRWLSQAAVTAGQLLIRIDPRDFRAGLDHARAFTDERQATLTSLEAKYVLQQQMVAQAEADLAAKTAKASFASADALRYRNLAKTGYGTQQSAERTSAVDQEAQSTIKAAEAALAAARQQLTVLQADIAAAHAAMAQAKADLETARLNLGYTDIRSPIDGYIGNRAGRVGAYVTSGAYLLSVIPAQGLWVDANFKEDQLARQALSRPCREPGTGHRCGLQRDPAGERHWQFYENRSARAGAHRPR